MSWGSNLRWFTFTWLVLHFSGESNNKGHPITCLRRHTWRVVVQLYNLHARWGWVVNATPQPLPGRGPGTHCRGSSVSCTAGLDLYGEEKISSPTKFRTSDRPGSSKSLYRLRYSTVLLWEISNYQEELRKRAPK